MENDEDIPKLVKDFQKWSDLDYLLPKLDLDVELFQMRNVSLANFVILAGLLKENQLKRQKYLEILSPGHFDPKSLHRYLFEKINSFLQENETIPENELENWIPEYMKEVWGESPPEERMFYVNNFNLRLILNFTPTEEQVLRAIELRKEKKDRYGY